MAEFTEAGWQERQTPDRVVLCVNEIEAAFGCIALYKKGLAAPSQVVVELRTVKDDEVFQIVDQTTVRDSDSFCLTA
jgi:hypothetical protein